MCISIPIKTRKPYVKYYLKDPPKEKEKKKEEERTYVAVDNNTTFYPTAAPQTAPVIHVPVPAPRPVHYVQQQYHLPGGTVAVPAQQAATWYEAPPPPAAVHNRANQDHHMQQAVPYASSTSPQHYCKELDGSYTLRTTQEIGNSCMPGEWQLSSQGHYYWIRRAA